MPGLRVFVLPKNRGKGAAVLFGLRQAQAAGFTHVLTMDSDGQHPAERIPAFMQASIARPEAMVLGLPGIRCQRARPAGQGPANLQLVGQSRDFVGRYPRFAVRLSRLPHRPLIAIMRRQPWMRRFDFDVEAVVRLCWRGVPPINLPAPVRYFRPEEGGVSHFNYWRDNVLLTWMHFRLFWGFILRLPVLVRGAWHRTRRSAAIRGAIGKRRKPLR
jgi:glycosyltransferase involved in cell wall biosynthesis